MLGYFCETRVHENESAKRCTDVIRDVIYGSERIHSCVKVFKDTTFSVTLLGRQVDSSIIAEETKLSSPDILSKILNFLDTTCTKFCKESTGFSDLFSTTRVFARISFQILAPSKF